MKQKKKGDFRKGSERGERKREKSSEGGLSFQNKDPHSRRKGRVVFKKHCDKRGLWG